MTKSYQEINAETIDRWVEEGWEWGKPVSHEEYINAKNGSWNVLLTPTVFVPHEWFGNLKGKIMTKAKSLMVTGILALFSASAFAAPLPSEIYRPSHAGHIRHISPFRRPQPERGRLKTMFQRK